MEPTNYSDPTIGVSMPWVAEKQGRLEMTTSWWANNYKTLKGIALSVVLVVSFMGGYRFKDHLDHPQVADAAVTPAPGATPKAP